MMDATYLKARRTASGSVAKILSFALREFSSSYFGPETASISGA